MADVAQVDKDQIEKVLYFLMHQLRKAHHLGQTMTAFVYNEKGKIVYETADSDKPDAAKYNVPAPGVDDDDVDPLS